MSHFSHQTKTCNAKIHKPVKCKWWLSTNRIRAIPVLDSACALLRYPEAKLSYISLELRWPQLLHLAICNLDILKVIPQTCAAIGSIAVGQVYDASEGRSILIMYEWDATAREIYNFCCAFSRLMIRWCDLTCGLLMRIVWPLPRTLHWRRFAVGRKLLIVQ